MVAWQVITDSSSTLQSAITTTIPFSTEADYPMKELNWDDASYQSYHDWRQNDSYGITLSYDGTTSLASLIDDNTLSIAITLRDI